MWLEREAQINSIMAGEIDFRVYMSNGENKVRPLLSKSATNFGRPVDMDQ